VRGKGEGVGDAGDVRRAVALRGRKLYYKSVDFVLVILQVVCY
jgi:hypothetical protein